MRFEGLHIFAGTEASRVIWDLIVNRILCVVYLAGVSVQTILRNSASTTVNYIGLTSTTRSPVYDVM